MRKDILIENLNIKGLLISGCWDINTVCIDRGNIIEKNNINENNLL